MVLWYVTTFHTLARPLDARLSWLLVPKYLSLSRDQSFACIEVWPVSISASRKASLSWRSSGIIALIDFMHQKILLTTQAALLAGVLTSTGSWPHILPDGAEKPWPVRTSWYCGIILSLFSILTAADQTIRLHRLSSHRDAWKNIRNLLVKSRGKVRRSKETGRILPSMGQIYTLQLPVMFLTTATISMIVGMFLHVWSAAARSVGLDSNAKVWPSLFFSHILGPWSFWTLRSISVLTYFRWR